MSAVIPGRFTAAVQGPFVVFIIGFRVNQVFAFRKWWPVATAMQPTAGRRLGQEGEASVPTPAPPA